VAFLARVRQWPYPHLLGMVGMVLLSAVATTAVVNRGAGPPVEGGSVAAGMPIAHVDIVLRAESWVAKVMYGEDQADAVPDGDGDYYRPDAGGLVSMAWHLAKPASGRDRTVADFANWSGVQPVSSLDYLEAGDALISAGLDNIVIFERWRDARRSAMLIVQQHKPGSPASQDVVQRSFVTATYRPLRYFNSVRDPMRNGSSDTIGYYNPRDDRYYVTDSPLAAPGTYESWPAGIARVPGAVPLVGDWNSDSHDSLGYYDPRDGTFRLSDSLPGRPGAHQVVRTNFELIPGVEVLAGDWNGDGFDTLGYYNPNDGTIWLSNRLNGGVGDYHKLTAVSIPKGADLLVGDWDGNGQDSLGYFDGSTGDFVLNDSIDDNVPGYPYVWHTSLRSSSHLQVIVGDWDSDGRASVGYYDSSDGYIHLSNTLDDRPVTYRTKTGIEAVRGARILVGDWRLP
jgi:hypothetical protein